MAKVKPIIPIKADTCSSCRAFVPDGEDGPMCRRHPRQYIIEADWAGWCYPPTDADEYCLDFLPILAS